MKPLPTNLASRPFRNNAVLGSVLGSIAALLVLATVFNLTLFLRHGSSYAEMNHEQASDRERLAKVDLEEARLAREIQKRDFRRLQARERIAGELILRHAFSWTLLFNKLETVVPAEVMMTAIRPNITADAIVVRVDGVAKSYFAFLDLQDKLLANQVFARISPISERKLNPSRPEITFALNFGYLPKVAAPAALLAAGAAPGAAAGSTSPASPGAAAGAPSPASPGRAAGTPTPRVAAPAPVPASAPALGIVGRDGQLRTATALSRMFAAPGSIYLPPGARPSAPAAPKQAGPKPQKPRAAPAGTPPAATAAPQPSARLLQVPVRGEPGLPPGLLPGALPPKVRMAAEVGRGVVPADRLDLPMRFADRPVGEIYAALAQAHGVRFDLDPGVDPRARISASLSGKTLADAIAIVARAAGHRVHRESDGVYRVVLPAGGAAIADKPLQEETLFPAEGRP